MDEGGVLELLETKRSHSKILGLLLVALGVLDEPLHGDINVDLVLCRDGVAAHLPVLNGLEVTNKERKKKRKEE